MQRIIIGLDPGPEFGGLVVIDESLKVRGSYSQKAPDKVIYSPFFLFDGDVTIVVEGLSPRGGATPGQMYARWGRTIETAEMIGYYRRLAQERNWEFVKMLPSTWRAHLCGTAGASDALTKACVREVYEQLGLAKGGGKQPAVGIKSQKGPLYGVKGHAWDALGVALAWMQSENLLPPIVRSPDSTGA